MTLVGNVQIKVGKEYRTRHILTIRDNTWLDIYANKEEALAYALKAMNRRHENARKDVREYAKAVRRLRRELDKCDS